jgi:hypothetical protein
VAHCIISYDLHDQRTYQPVWNLLGQWGAVRLFESLWVVSLNASVGRVRDALAAVMDNDDSVAAIEMSSGASWASTRARQAGRRLAHARHSPLLRPS